jgi:hypothetical protein
VFFDAVGAVVLSALARIGDDPDARYAFFQRIFVLGQEVAAERSAPDSWSWMCRFRGVPADDLSYGKPL